MNHLSTFMSMKWKKKKVFQYKGESKLPGTTLNCWLCPCDHHNQPPQGCHCTSIPLTQCLSQRLRHHWEEQFPYPKSTGNAKLEGTEEHSPRLICHCNTKWQLGWLQFNTEAQNSLEFCKIRPGVRIIRMPNGTINKICSSISILQSYNIETWQDTMADGVYLPQLLASWD